MHKMTKKERKKRDSWNRFAAALFLSNYPGQDLEDDGNAPGYGGNNCTEPDNSILSLCFSESTLVCFHPSFVGYLIAALDLLKQAFCHKKRKHLILICRDRFTTTI